MTASKSSAAALLAAWDSAESPSAPLTSAQRDAIDAIKSKEGEDAGTAEDIPGQPRTSSIVNNTVLVDEIRHISPTCRRVHSRGENDHSIVQAFCNRHGFCGGGRLALSCGTVPGEAHGQARHRRKIPFLAAFDGGLSPVARRRTIQGLHGAIGTAPR